MLPQMAWVELSRRRYELILTVIFATVLYLHWHLAHNPELSDPTVHLKSKPTFRLIFWREDAVKHFYDEAAGGRPVSFFSDASVRGSFNSFSEIAGMIAAGALRYNQSGRQADADALKTSLESWFGDPAASAFEGGSFDVADALALPAFIDAISLSHTVVPMEAVSTWLYKQQLAMGAMGTRSWELLDFAAAVTLSYWFENTQLTKQMVAEVTNRDMLAAFTDVSEHSAGELDAAALVAHVASKVGVDLWGWEHQDGWSLRSVFERAARGKVSPATARALERPLRLAHVAYDDVVYLRAIYEFNGKAMAASPHALLTPPAAQFTGAYAVAFAFHRAKKLPMNDIGSDGICALAANALWTYKIFDDLKMVPRPDVLMLADPSEADFLTESERHLLDTLGVRIVHSDAIRVFNESGNIHCTGYPQAIPFFGINMLKVEVACLPYDVVQFLDVDNFVITMREDHFRHMGNAMCRGKQGRTSPLSGSDFLLAPSVESCFRFRETAAAGFNVKTGWGNAGRIPIWNSCSCPKSMIVSCRKMGLPVNLDDSDDPWPRMCNSTDGMMDWGFHGNCADQGILHYECAIATQTGIEVEPRHVHIDRTMMTEHYYGGTKPWKGGDPSLFLNGGRTYVRALEHSLVTSPLFASVCGSVLKRPSAPTSAPY